MDVNKVDNIGQGKPKYYSLFVNGDIHILSSDYLGPSIYWAKELGFDDEQILKWLAISRTIGGHILFPGGFIEGYCFDYQAKKYILKKKNNSYIPPSLR